MVGGVDESDETPEHPTSVMAIISATIAVMVICARRFVLLPARTIPNRPRLLRLANRIREPGLEFGPAGVLNAACVDAVVEIVRVVPGAAAATGTYASPIAPGTAMPGPPLVTWPMSWWPGSRLRSTTA